MKHIFRRVAEHPVPSCSFDCQAKALHQTMRLVCATPAPYNRGQYGPPPFWLESHVDPQLASCGGVPLDYPWLVPNASCRIRNGLYLIANIIIRQITSEVTAKLIIIIIIKVI